MIHYWNLYAQQTYCGSPGLARTTTEDTVTCEDCKRALSVTRELEEMLA
jgi:hypothetical protein